MHIPDNATTLENTEAQIRLGVQGYGGTGKTWAALTFPNPIVLNLDRGLGAHSGRKDVLELPFWSDSFCKKINKSHKSVSDIKDTVVTWLNNEGLKIDPDQTLIIDGGTGLQNSYHSWYNSNRVYSKQSGEEDKYAQWRLKDDYFTEMFEVLKRLRCHVVCLWHEADYKEKDGSYKGKIRPLFTGKFGDQIVSHFTDFFRQIAADKPALDKIDDQRLRNWGMTKEEYVKFLATFPRNTIYAWQTESDDIFDGKCSSLVNFPRLVPANYSSFIKFGKAKPISVNS